MPIGHYEVMGDGMVMAVEELEEGRETPMKWTALICVGDPRNGRKPGNMAERVAFLLNHDLVGLISKLAFHLEPYSRQQLTQMCVYCLSYDTEHQSGCPIGTAKKWAEEYREIIGDDGHRSIP